MFYMITTDVYLQLDHDFNASTKAILPISSRSLTALIKQNLLKCTKNIQENVVATDVSKGPLANLYEACQTKPFRTHYY